jgi:hypothetical protein
MVACYYLRENEWAINKRLLKLDKNKNMDVKKDILRAIENTSDIYYQERSKKKILRG